MGAGEEMEDQGSMSKPHCLFDGGFLGRVSFFGLGELCN